MAYAKYAERFEGFFWPLAGFARSTWILASHVQSSQSRAFYRDNEWADPQRPMRNWVAKFRRQSS